MKRLSLFICLILLFVGICQSQFLNKPPKRAFQVQLEFELVALVQFGPERATHYDLKGSQGNEALVFEDRLLRTEWDITHHHLGLHLTNYADYPMKIIWDEASFINFDQSNSKVIRAGVLFEYKDMPQAQQVIAPDTHLKTSLIPTNKIHVYLRNYPEDHGYKLMPIFDKTYRHEYQAHPEKVKQTYLGKQVKILIPVELQDEKHYYQFTFEVVGFSFPSRS